MRRGLTLVEVLIAMSMLVVLLGSIGIALHSYLYTLDTARTGTAEAQLARAILEKIARDIRNTVVALKTETLEVDTESVQALFTGVQPPAAVSSLLDTAISSGDSGATTEVAKTLTGTTPGIYGDLEWLQIDTARLPRGEMYGGKMTRSGTSPLPDRLSPSKTVLYYLGEDTGLEQGRTTLGADAALGSLGRSLDLDAPKYGLYRRELDRLATQYMIDQGEEAERERYDDLLAPEVEAIEFLYFDAQSGGQSEATGLAASGGLGGLGKVGEWIESWNMDNIGYLPKAIRITLWIRRKGQDNRSNDSLTGQAPGIRTVAYSLIVVLPVVGEPTPETSETAE